MEGPRPGLARRAPGARERDSRLIPPEHPAPLRATVEQVCTDLYEGFAGAVKDVMPAARLVADRFHSACLYRGAVDTLRKSEMKEIKRALSAAEYAGLKGVVWAFRRNRRDLDAEA